MVKICYLLLHKKRYTFLCRMFYVLIVAANIAFHVKTAKKMQIHLDIIHKVSHMMQKIIDHSRSSHCTPNFVEKKTFQILVQNFND